MRRAAIVCSRVPLSFDIKRVKGHVTGSLHSPNISVLFLLCKCFSTDFFFPRVRLTASFAGFFSSLLFLSPSPFPTHTLTRARADTRADTHTHTEENLYVSDIQQGKDKGTELITHHLLLLRRTDGSRRYVNGKGQ